MNGICHADWCDLPLNEEGECSVCKERNEKQDAHYGALYASEHYYSVEDIESAYSEPSERAKRDRLLDEAVCWDIDSVLIAR